MLLLFLNRSQQMKLKMSSIYVLWFKRLRTDSLTNFSLQGVQMWINSLKFDLRLLLKMIVEISDAHQYTKE